MIMPIHETIFNRGISSADSFLFGLRVKIVFDVLGRNWVAVATDSDLGNVTEFALDLDAVETDRVVRSADGEC